MHYEYRITSDAPWRRKETGPATQKGGSVPFMAEHAQRHVKAGASWAEVQFVQVDDDGTVEELRRLRLD